MRFTPKIEQNSDPISYWLAMFGFFFIDLALLYFFAVTSYLWLKHSV